MTTYTPDRATVMDMPLDRLVLNTLTPRHSGQFKKFLGQFGGYIPTVREVLEKEAPLTYLQGLHGLRGPSVDAIAGALLRAGVQLSGVRPEVVPITHTEKTKVVDSPVSAALNKSMERIGATNAMIAERIGVPESYVERWRNGEAQPNVANLAKLLQLLWWEDARQFVCG